KCTYSVDATKAYSTTSCGAKICFSISVPAVEPRRPKPAACLAKVYRNRKRPRNRRMTLWTSYPAAKSLNFRSLTPATEVVDGTPAGSARQRLQPLEGQAFGVLHAGKIQPPDEGNGCITVASGEGDHGLDGNSLGV